MPAVVKKVNTVKANMRTLLLIGCLATVVLVWCFLNIGGGVGRPRLIAHAGGSIKGMTYTNSLDALDENFRKGHRVFEIDFIWTRDKRLVLFHDFGRTYETLFPGRSGRPTFDEFIHTKMRGGLTPMSIDRLADWLRRHDDAYIVTDVKAGNHRVLRAIAASYPDVQMRFVPQIYAFDELPYVRELGYTDVILTLYRMNAEPADVVDFATANGLLAVTVDRKHAHLDVLLRDLVRAGVAVYVHTVNDPREYEALLGKGAAGVYTDDLVPDALASSPRHR